MDIAIFRMALVKDSDSQTLYLLHFCSVFESFPFPVFFLIDFFFLCMQE